jgi:hypothetical protein
MSSKRRFYVSVIVFLLFAVTAPARSIAQKPKDKKPVAGATPVMWRDPGNIAEKDLYWGSGSEDRAPKPPFTFKSEDLKATQPKVDVTDANGEKWKVKFGREVHAETAATRLVWAFGYMVDETYFVPSGTIEGATGLKRARRFISADGTFQEARFEKRPKDLKRTDIRWAWGDNPFIGTKELSGLRILMTMLNNWDTRRRSKNNLVVEIQRDDGRIEDWYEVGDLGSTFGHMASLVHRTEWNLAEFKKQKFIDRVNGETLYLHYEGGSKSMNEVPLEHARWFAAMAGQLTENQVRRAFEAAGATPAEIDGFSSRVMEKIRELQSAVGELRP